MIARISSVIFRSAVNYLDFDAIKNEETRPINIVKNPKARLSVVSFITTHKIAVKIRPKEKYN
jgi:hypothetical protein